MRQHLHSVSVASVVVDDRGRALLGRRRDSGAWQAPGGVLEPDELITDGLVREVREEAGIDVLPMVLTGVYKNMSLGVVALVFRCQWLSGTPTPSDEMSEFRWVTAAEIDKVVTEAFAVRVRDALEFDGGPAVRHHDGTRLIAT